MKNTYQDFDELRFKWTNRKMEEGFLRLHITDNYKEELLILNTCIHKELYISGLTQNNLAYFIQNYGNRFPILGFIQCNRITDFSCLSQLSNVEYIIIECNNKVTHLWDMKNNTLLKGLCLEETKKIVSFEEITRAPHLEELVLREGVNSLTGSNTWKISTLKGIEKASHLKRVKLCIGAIMDRDITPLLTMKNLERLYMITNLFKLGDFASLNATLKRTIVTPDKPFYINDYESTVLVVGKSRNLKKDNPKLIELQKQWDEIVK